MRVTVCELNSDMDGLAADWPGLVTHVRQANSDLVLLPEMPFAPWLAVSTQYNDRDWQAAEDAHMAWMTRLGELGAPWVAASRPANRAGQRHNIGFIWQAKQGLQDVHTKYYLPDEERFWEASWYARGSGQDFDVVPLGPARVAFLICTELWFFEWARRYGKAGASIILTPRATERQTIGKWLAGGRALAVSAGAYSLSSNRVSRDGLPQTMGGGGWIIDPDGEVLAHTTKENPFATAAIDLERAELAKSSYPRYVKE
jgi:N-carbamoylputrescine amidase